MTQQQILRELTAAERRTIRRLVLSECASYDREYGCLPLNSACIMLKKFWTGGICPVIEQALKGEYFILKNVLMF